jgi:hypothetical protein
MSREQAETTGMSGGAEQLREQLRDAVELIRRSGGGVVFERYPGSLQEEPLSDEIADGIDARGGPVAPDAAAAAHRALVDAADELAETLAQLDATAWRSHPLRAPRGAS